MLDDRSRRKKPTNGEPASKPPVTRSSGIKLAPLPSSSQPTAPADAPEAAPQKPDLRLPVDAIKAASRSGGTKPLIDHVRKQQGKRRDLPDEPIEGLPTKPVFPRERGGRAKEMISGEMLGPPTARGRRTGKGGTVPDEPGLLVGREQRQLNRRRTTTDARPRGEEEEAAPTRRRGSSRNIKRTGANTAAPRKSKVTLELPCTVRSFSEAIGVPAQQVLRQMLLVGHDGQHQRRDRSGNGRTAGRRAGRGNRLQEGARPGRTNARRVVASSPTTRPCSSPARRSSPSWATSTTARRRCWIGSSASTWSAAKAAASRSTSAPTRSRRTAARSRSSIRRATRRSPRCGPAAPTSPTSPCWSWRPTTASCRRPKRRSATPARPACRSSWR